MKRSKKFNVRILTESAIMISLSTVLSLFKIAQMPYGGAVTVASALPIVIIAYRYGMGTGLFAGAVHAMLQLTLGMSDLSYATTWQSAVAIIMLDYVLAFMLTGIAGIFRKTVKTQATALTLGAMLTCVIRYACHVISGATVWAGISIPTAAALSYSFIYNATYMIPETIVLCIATLYTGSVIDFRHANPKRIAAQKSKTKGTWMMPAAGLAVCAALIYDIAEIFEHMQDAETGKFSITALSEANWQAVAIVSTVGLIAALSLITARKIITERKKDEESL